LPRRLQQDRNRPYRGMSVGLAFSGAPKTGEGCVFVWLASPMQCLGPISCRV
jgi:hypothetical protein